MAYDLDSERRIDEATIEWGLGKKKMSSGLAYFVDGNMCFAIRGGELLLRLDETQVEKVVQLSGIHIAVDGCASHEKLAASRWWSYHRSHQVARSPHHWSRLRSDLPT